MSPQQNGKDEVQYALLRQAAEVGVIGFDYSINKCYIYRTSEEQRDALRALEAEITSGEIVVTEGKQRYEEILAARAYDEETADEQMIDAYGTTLHYQTREDCMRELFYDMLMRYPGVLRQVKEEIPVLRDADRIIGDADGVVRRQRAIIDNAKRLALLVAYGVISVQLTKYTFQDDNDETQTLYNTMKDQEMTKKYNVQHGVVCAVAERMLEWSEPSHPEHGLYLILTEIEDELNRQRHDDPEPLIEGFKQRGAAYKKQLDREITVLRSTRTGEELTIMTRNFVLETKKAMVDQLMNEAGNYGMVEL